MIGVIYIYSDNGFLLFKNQLRFISYIRNVDKGSILDNVYANDETILQHLELRLIVSNMVKCD